MIKPSCISPSAISFVLLSVLYDGFLPHFPTDVMKPDGIVIYSKSLAFTQYLKGWPEF